MTTLPTIAGSLISTQDAKSCRSRSAGVLKSMRQLTIRTAIEAHDGDYSPIRRHRPRYTAPACPPRLPLHVLEQLKAQGHSHVAIEEWFCKPKVRSSILSAGTTKSNTWLKSSRGCPRVPLENVSPSRRLDRNGVADHGPQERNCYAQYLGRWKSRSRDADLHVPPLSVHCRRLHSLVYFSAQNSAGVALVWNRGVHRKVQGRADLPLTLVDDADSFL